jgi:hypothetical protein
VHGLQSLDRVRDRAAAREQRVGQLADALLRGVADREITHDATDHWRERVPAREEAPHVIGERDFGIGRHAPQHSVMSEITQIRVIRQG